MLQPGKKIGLRSFGKARILAADCGQVSVNVLPRGEGAADRGQCHNDRTGRYVMLAHSANMVDRWSVNCEREINRIAPLTGPSTR